VIGQPRQQRPARNIIDVLDFFGKVTFLPDGGADIRRSGVLAAVREIEEDAVRRKVYEIGRLEIFD
jgi:hypothetical protein